MPVPHRVLAGEISSAPPARRAEERFREQQNRTHRRVDRMFAWLMVAQWAFALGCAVWSTPDAGAAAWPFLHPHVLAAAVLGGLLTGVPVVLVVRMPGHAATRHVIAVAQVLWSALLIHVTGGRLETPFHVFVSLAFLALYRDWRILPGAVLAIVADHVLRGLVWPQSVHGVADAAWWWFLENCGWMMFEAALLIVACRASERELRQWAQAQAEIELLSAKLADQRTLLTCQSNASQEGVLVISPAGEVLSINRRFKAIWRLRDDESLNDRKAVVAAAVAQVVDPETFTAHTAELYAHPDREMTELVPLKDGRVIERYSAPVRSNAGGGHLGRGWYFRDVTERMTADAEVRALNTELARRTEALAAANAELERRVHELRQTQDQLLFADRLSSLGRVAASIGHEINNPLTYVIGNLEEILRAGELPPGARELLAEALEGGEQVRRIVGGLKSIARMAPDQREPVDLHAVLESTVRMASNELRHRGRLIRDYGTLPMVAGDASRLGQVFLNLIVNATQALSGPRDGGHFIAIHTRTSPLGQAVVEIEDSGEGIPADRIPRLFDPFFTTKAVGVGTGLGLSICHGIVSEHGGTIEVDSVPGAGSRFRVVLPALTGELVAAPAPAVQLRDVAPGGPRMSILLIDDDARLLRSLQRRLARRYEVEACEGATPALEALAAGRRFDAILCDLHMPDVTGAEFYHRVSAEFPGVAPTIIFMTGGAFTAEATEFARDCANPSVEKPVDMVEIDKLISQVAAVTATGLRPPRGTPRDATW